MRSMTALSSSVSVDVLTHTDKYIIATWRRLVMLIWNGEANAEGVEHSRTVFEEWAKDQARGAALLIVVPARHANPPDENTRQAMRQTAGLPSAKLKGMGTFIQAEGFVAATIRSVIMRLNVLTGDGAQNLFETASKAAEWAAKVLDDSEISGAKLTNAIRTAHERAGVVPITNSTVRSA